MRYIYITNIEIIFDKKKTFNRKSIKYLQNFIFQESVKLPVCRQIASLPGLESGLRTFLNLQIIKISDIFAPGIEIWCNGSTTDFGSVCPGSNPGIST